MTTAKITRGDKSSQTYSLFAGCLGHVSIAGTHAPQLQNMLMFFSQHSLNPKMIVHGDGV